jgi:hypothetical protein
MIIKPANYLPRLFHGFQHPYPQRLWITNRPPCSPPERPAVKPGYIFAPARGPTKRRLSVKLQGLTATQVKAFLNLPL